MKIASQQEDSPQTSRKPQNINHLEAASLTLVGGTVWEALVSRAQLAVHETILIHGGAGGVGTVAIQLAKAIGARVITTARRSNHEVVRSLGADEVIDHTSEDYVSAVAELTHGQVVNVVFDTIGGDTLTKSALALADAGRLVSIVDIAQPQNLIEAWGKNAAYHFVFTRQNRGKLNALTNLVERGLIKPVIGAVLPLVRTGKAHELLEGGSSVGFGLRWRSMSWARLSSFPRCDRYIDKTAIYSHNTILFENPRTHCATAAIASRFPKAASRLESVLFQRKQDRF